MSTANTVGRTEIRAWIVGLLLAVSILQVAPAQEAGDLDSLAARVRVLEDREEIRALLRAYGEAHDHRNYRAFAELFADAGEWAGGLGSTKGREAIFELMNSTIGHDPRPQGSGTYHLLANDQIALDGDRASATTLWIFLTPGADGNPRIVYLGHYADQFIRERGRWRFLRREALVNIPVSQ